MPVVITGTDGVIYQGFPAPLFGEWGLPIMGSPPYNYYLIGKNKYYIRPGAIPVFPYWGPFRCYTV
jgi:hypothetical protein